MDDFYKALDSALNRAMGIGGSSSNGTSGSHQRRMTEKDSLDIITRCEREMSDPDLLQEERQELSRIISREMSKIRHF